MINSVTNCYSCCVKVLLWLFVINTANNKSQLLLLSLLWRVGHVYQCGLCLSMGDMKYDVMIMLH